MVRQISQSRGFYTTKVTKATDTSSGFNTWGGQLPRERIGYVQSLRQEERTLNPRVLLHQRGLTAT